MRTFGGRVELLGYIDNLEVLAATGTVVLLIFGTGSR
jgi:hypothetical protein